MRAFARCGVNYTGPFLTKQGRGRVRQKRYLCLFTCAATRAVLAWSLDTDSFVAAFTRMTSRRGVPLEVISDNGTNFVGENNELKELLALLDQQKTKNNMANKGIEWKFNPPGASHFRGFYEALIKGSNVP